MRTPKATPILFLRSLVFYAGFYPVTIVFSIICLIVGPLLPFRARFRFFTLLNAFDIAWLRICCGVKVSVTGREHLPTQGSYVVIANHQSEWETLYFQLLIGPQSVVLKRELLRIPLFGWALALLKPIALDRSKRRGALKQLLEQGKARLQAGIPLLIFPQGTRLPVGKLGKLNKGGAMLAVSSEVPIIPVAHNAGLFWPGKSFIKYPGTVEVAVGPAVDTRGKTVEEVHEATAGWLEQTMRAQGSLD
ncbi:MAG: 1-acyl-sn-glycerol-3-phosphate acyltransferase [Oceanospirillales bacterium]|uniref:1-acyl-sn-glycerol-3-phosphate acyltransferase n=1 Tax=Marinobacterium halophilum TaxID=267374 RepID=A0A2P8EXW2_9GAMM|nr:lysophospholipid acyltransferase family protein [Marinobacterium halophilum]MBR9827432.1 1-acyl-sn-glycerol-3-phosphate acyltransferase [Oceanospirillales bacterium]PSL14303.1 1-acyl-sn-glycerol-3-phosphate acyltransferase [Marinobacterium halophilum]